jgi:hypothetical protein
VLLVRSTRRLASAPDGVGPDALASTG